MHTYTILGLALSFDAVIGGGVASRLEEGKCLTWGGNATTTVFYNCCKEIALETSPQLALTASCPNRESDYDSSLFPGGVYIFSRIQLDECLHLHHGQYLVSMDDVTPQEALEVENINTACDLANFTLIDDPPQLQGVCGNHSVVYPLDFFILSSRGVLICGGFSHGVASASLDDTCCNITLNTDNRDDPQLSAVCQTNRFRRPGCHDLGNTGEWRATNISLNSCQVRQPDPKNGLLLGHVDGCTKSLLDGTPVVLSTNCGAHKTNSSLSESIRNEYGRLACYDFKGS